MKDREQEEGRSRPAEVRPKPGIRKYARPEILTLYLNVGEGAPIGPPAKSKFVKKK
jgi:hypothetical protein